MTTKQVWTKYSEDLKRFIISKVKNTGIADDILQDTFIKIHTKLHTLKDITKLKSWIFSIARNSILDYWKSENKTFEIINFENEETIEENIHTNIEHYENIALSDLQAYYENKSQFKDIHWLSDPSELEVDFIKLKDACEKIQKQEIESDIPSEIFAQGVWEQYSSIQESFKTL